MKTLRMQNLKKAKQEGFTIIELVVVILLLGILTATALPRFLDVTDEAHDAVVDAVFGGAQTGLALFRASYVAQGEPDANTLITSYGAGTLRNNAAGYPVSTTSDVDGIIDDAADCTEVYGALLQNGAPALATAEVAASNPIVAADITGSNGEFQVLFNATAAAETCYFAYTGQYTTHAAAVAASDTVPLIIYNSATGVLSRSNSGAL